MVEILNFEPGRVSMPTPTALTQPNSETMVEVCDFDPIYSRRWINTPMVEVCNLDPTHIESVYRLKGLRFVFTNPNEKSIGS